MNCKVIFTRGNKFAEANRIGSSRSIRSLHSLRNELRAISIRIEFHQESGHAVGVPADIYTASLRDCVYARSIQAVAYGLHDKVIDAVAAAGSAVERIGRKRAQSNIMTIARICREQYAYFLEAAGRTIKASQFRERREVIRIGHYTNCYAAVVLITERASRQAERHFEVGEIADIRQYNIVIDTVEEQISCIKGRRIRVGRRIQVDSLQRAEQLLNTTSRARRMHLVNELLEREGLIRTCIESKADGHNARRRNAERKRECPFRSYAILYSLYVNLYNLASKLVLRQLHLIISSGDARLINKAILRSEVFRIAGVCGSNLQVPRVSTMQLSAYRKASWQYVGCANVARRRSRNFANDEVIQEECVLQIRLRNEGNIATFTGIACKRNAEMLELQSVVKFHLLNRYHRTDIVRVGQNAYRKLSSILLVAIVEKVLNRTPEIHFAVSEVTVDFGRYSIQQTVTRDSRSRGGECTTESKISGRIYRVSLTQRSRTALIDSRHLHALHTAAVPTTRLTKTIRTADRFGHFEIFYIRKIYDTSGHELSRHPIGMTREIVVAVGANVSIIRFVRIQTINAHVVFVRG